MCYINHKTNYVYLLFFLFIIGPFSISAADLHAILVADVADTNIGRYVQEDLRKFRSQAIKIANYTHLQLKQNIFYVHEPEQLKSYLQDLQVNNDDVILFHFSGHGYHSDDQKITPWPTLYFYEHQGMAVDDIINVLEIKKARLTLIFINACNAPLPEGCLMPSLVKIKARHYLEKKNYKKLFLKTTGRLILTSSKSGEYTYAGTYVNGLCKALACLATMETQAVNWQVILESASQEIEKLAASIDVIQHPFFINETQNTTQRLN